MRDHVEGFRPRIENAERVDGHFARGRKQRSKASKDSGYGCRHIGDAIDELVSGSNAVTTGLSADQDATIAEDGGAYPHRYSLWPILMSAASTIGSSDTRTPVREAAVGSLESTYLQCRRLFSCIKRPQPMSPAMVSNCPGSPGGTISKASSMPRSSTRFNRSFASLGEQTREIFGTCVIGRFAGVTEIGEDISQKCSFATRFAEHLKANRQVVPGRKDP